MTDKAGLRRDVVSRVRALKPAVRALEEELVQAAVQAEDAWRDARTVLLYRAHGWELSVVGLTLAAWRAGKRVAFPRVAGAGVLTLHEVRSWSDLKPGAYGLQEPAAEATAVAAAEVDVAVVPGVAFDAAGGRLGRGEGYYDRLLPHLGGQCWGVGFSAQLVPEVPAEAHDRRLHRVFAPVLLGLE